MIPAPPPGEDDPLLDSTDTGTVPGKFVVLAKGGATPKPHVCKRPGRWGRRRLGLGYGAIIVCSVCGQEWRRAEGRWDLVTPDSPRSFRPDPSRSERRP